MAGNDNDNDDDGVKREPAGSKDSVSKGRVKGVVRLAASRTDKVADTFEKLMEESSGLAHESFELAKLEDYDSPLRVVHVKLGVALSNNFATLAAGRERHRKALREGN